MPKHHKQIIVMGTPGSGATWIADCILKAHTTLVAPLDCREFFNPLWHAVSETGHSRTIEAGFASSYPPLYKHIAGEVPDAIMDTIYERTWKNESYTFCCDELNFMRWQWFAEKFLVVPVFREAKHLWPVSGRDPVYGRDSVSGRDAFRLIADYCAVFESFRASKWRDKIEAAFASIDQHRNDKHRTCNCRSSNCDAHCCIGNTERIIMGKNGGVVTATRRI